MNKTPGQKGRKGRFTVAMLLILLFIPGVQAALADQSGWPKSIGVMVASSPNLVDLDGDGDFETIIGAEDGTIYAWHGDGTDVDGWPKSTGYNAISTPAAGDLDGDGDLEVIAVSTQTGVNVPKSSIYAWHHDGTAIWVKTIVAGMTSSPALGDIDNDGDLEIIIGAEDNNIYAMNHDGSDVSGWPKTTNGKTFNSPALADLDGDGNLEIIAGSTDGNVYAWHHDGTLYWSFETGEIQESSPALADIDGDGQLEIVVGSAYILYAINHDGTLLWSNSDIIAASSPAIGDIDADGDLEIVVGTRALYPGNKVYALESDGTVTWSKQLRDYQLVEYIEEVGSTPVIGDLDGDGAVEILVATTINHVQLVEGRLYAWNGDGTQDWYEPIDTESLIRIRSSPAIGDLDGDGDVEIVLGLTNGNVHAWDLAGAYNPDNIEWAMFRHDAGHIGTQVMNNRLDVTKAQTDEAYYTGGETVTVSCKISDYYGVRVPADTVNADVQKPDGSTDTIALSVDGIGSYSGTFVNTFLKGEYTVTINADKTGYASGTAGTTFGITNAPEWHYKIPVDVEAGASERIDAAIDTGIDFTQKLGELGITGTFDINSPRVYETDPARTDLHEVSSQFEKQIGAPGITNIAQGKTATASSQASGTYNPGRTVDGTTGGYPWAGAGNHQDWLKIDLGEATNIAKIVMTGYMYRGVPSFPKDFTIQVSTDDNSYTIVEEVTGNADFAYTLQFSSQVNARYVKLDVTQNNGPWRTFVSEFEIYPLEGSVYDPETNAAGNLKWIMNGTTAQDTTRYYNVYFDVLEGGTKPDPEYGVDYSALTMPDGITVTQGATEEIVIPPNQPPTASITEPADGSAYNPEEQITFTGTGTDNDGLVVAYTWSSNLDGALSTASSFTTSTLSAGTHTITFTAMDDDGVTTSAQTTVRVNIPPTVSITSPADDSVYARSDTIVFDSTETEPDGTIESYAWTSNIDGTLSDTFSFSASGLSIGVHVITLTATDNDGATGTAQVALRINDPPTASIVSPAGAITVLEQTDAAFFNGTGTDTDGTIESYAWTSSIDGALSDSASFETSALSKGVHTITLTVTDNDGGTGTATTTVDQAEYDFEWLIKEKESHVRATTVPVKFTIRSPITGDFIADETVTVRIYNPDGSEASISTYAADDDVSRKDTDVRIDEAQEQYITNFHTQKDFPTGTYTIKVEFTSNRPGTSFETTFDVHTPVSKPIKLLLDRIPRFGGGPSEGPVSDQSALVLEEEVLDEIEGITIKTIDDTGYDIEWMLARKTLKPGSDVPIKFAVYNPMTGGFVIDNSVFIRVYDPDMRGIASYDSNAIRIDAEGEQYVTSFKTSKDAPTGEYTVKAGFTRISDESETTVEVHTTFSKVIDNFVKILEGIFRR